MSAQGSPVSALAVEGLVKRYYRSPLRREVSFLQRRIRIAAPEAVADDDLLFEEEVCREPEPGR